MSNLTARRARIAHRRIVTGLELQYGYTPGELLTPTLHRGEVLIHRQGEGTWPTAPVLVRKYEGWSTTTEWAIVWEGGPDEWVHHLDCGLEETHGATQPPICTPDWLFCEPIQSFSLGLYHND
jgi:hypothetical protein